jgi:hypothetical protein
MKPENHAAYLRMRRATSTDFKLYEAEKVKSSRARKEAEQAKAELARVTAWPLRDGYQAARAREAFDETQSPDWQLGYQLGKRK